MRPCSFFKIFLLVVLMLVMCVSAHAGQSASKTLRLSVTLPAVLQNDNHQTGSFKSKLASVVMEEEMRDNQIVMVQTTIAK